MFRLSTVIYDSLTVSLSQLEGISFSLLFLSDPKTGA